jgi:hypothetical protein
VRCRKPCLPDEGPCCLGCALAYSEPDQDDEERDTLAEAAPWACPGVETDPTYPLPGDPQ